MDAECFSEIDVELPVVDSSGVAVVMSPKCRYVFILTTDSLHQFELETLREIRVVSGLTNTESKRGVNWSIGAQCISHDGASLLVTYDGRLSVRQMNVETWKSERTLLKGLVGGTYDMDCNAEVLVACAYGELVVADWVTGLTIKTIKQGFHSRGLSFTPDGSRLFVANMSSDRIVCFKTKDLQTHCNCTRIVQGPGPGPGPGPGQCDSSTCLNYSRRKKSCKTKLVPEKAVFIPRPCWVVVLDSLPSTPTMVTACSVTNQIWTDNWRLVCTTQSLTADVSVMRAVTKFRPVIDPGLRRVCRGPYESSVCVVVRDDATTHEWKPRLFHSLALRWDFICVCLCAVLYVHPEMNKRPRCAWWSKGWVNAPDIELNKLRYTTTQLHQHLRCSGSTLLLTAPLKRLLLLLLLCGVGVLLNP